MGRKKYTISILWGYRLLTQWLPLYYDIGMARHGTPLLNPHLVGAAHMCAKQGTLFSTAVLKDVCSVHSL